MDPSGEQGDGPIQGGPPLIPQGDGNGPPPGSNFNPRQMQQQGDLNEEELMMKVRQQQQMIDMDKQREVQQQMMEQQQLVMLEVQRSEQQKRMLGPGSAPLAPAGLSTTSGIRSSGVQLVTQQRPNVMPHQGGPPPPPQRMPGQSGPQNMGQGGPPQNMGPGGPPPQNQQMGHNDPPRSMAQGGPPPPMGQGGSHPPMSQSGPPPQMGGPPQMSQGGPPPQMGQGGPPPQMGQGGPPPQMGQGGPPPQMGQGGPPPQMGQGGPPPQMGQGGPPPQMGQGGPPPQMGQGGPPPQMGGPPQMNQGGPPPQMGQGGPPPQMGQGGPPQMGQGGPPPQMGQGGPPQMNQGGPPPQMGQGGPPPQMGQGGPPQMNQGGPPPQMGQGGPPQMNQGGPPPQMGQGGPPPQMGQGGPPQMNQGGPPPQMGQGGPNQGGPPPLGMRPGGPPQNMGPGGPPQNMGPGGPPQNMGPGGPPQNMGPGGPPPMRGPNPQMGQGGPPQGMRSGGPPQGMLQGGPPPGMRGGPPPPPMGPGGPGPRSDQPMMDIDERRPPLMDIDERIRDDGRRPNQMENNAPPPRQPPPHLNQNQGRMNRPPYNGPNGPLGKDGPNRPPSSSQNQGPKEMRLPQALEKMLEFKSQREHEIGLEMDNEESEQERNNKEKEDDFNEDFDREENEDDEDDDEENDEKIINKDGTKETKNKRKKKKKKKARRNRFETQKKEKKKRDKKSKAPEVQVEYIQEEPELDPTDPNYHTFAKIFEAFKITQPEFPKEIKVEDKPKIKDEPVKVKGIQEDDDDEDDDMMTNDEDGPKISKKKLKKLTRLTVAQLKQLVTRPDVVEMHDVTARDPRLLVHLKATRNSVPVPRHWSYKRKYLQGKRGIEKTPFELPDFIKATGIEEMRAALQEKEDQKTLKSKMREKVRPKMGKIDIDYQKLHDAFFRFQTKPKMTIHGDLYYEAKEFETKLREKKPGNISDDLKMALGMPIGMNSEKVPPPWLIAMQRYGPPPSYPNLKVAGLNAPIPESCMFGYHAGGWGKPPVDENGKPLYGDVFGTQAQDYKAEIEEDDIDKAHWGELESESESEESSEEEEEEDKDESGLITPAEGLMTPGGITSVPIGMETPDQIELRKKRIEDAMDQGGDTPALYQVVPEKKAAPIGGAMMGSAHVYDLGAVAAGQKKPGEKPSAADGVEVSLNPEELELDTAAMQAKYDQTVREQQSQLEKEDLSDMVAAHAAKQRKRKKAQENTNKGAKKYKDFKF